MNLPRFALPVSENDNEQVSFSHRRERFAFYSCLVGSFFQCPQCNTVRRDQFLLRTVINMWNISPGSIRVLGEKFKS